MDQRTIQVWVAVAAVVVAAFAIPGAAMADEPAPTAGLIAASDHTCGLTTVGGVTCWGDNSAGGLGDGTTTASLTPVDVAGLASGVTAVAAGDRFSCALTTGGGVKCWGLNESGQLGDGSTTDRLVPVDVKGLSSGVAAIAARGEHTCALTTGGGVKCWGWNNKGQLGIGTTTDSTIPVDIEGLAAGVIAIAAGGRHTCALMAAGEMKCWGYNEAGQLGNGTTSDSATAIDVAGLAGNVSAITLGGNFTCALTTLGGVACWGVDLTGAALDVTVPTDVTGLERGVEAIVAGYYHACALKAGGVVACWGGNDTGQLGSGTTTDSPAPVDVVGADGTPLAFGPPPASQTWSPFLIAGAVALGTVLVAAAGYVTIRRRRR